MHPYTATPRRQQSLEKRVVLTIIDGPHVAGDGRSAHDRYTKETRNQPQAHVYRADTDKGKIVNNLVSISLYLFCIFLFIFMVLCLF